MFFLCRGYCEVFKTFDSQRQLYITTMEAGCMFGEIAAVLGCRSSATVMCKNYCTVAALSIEDY